MNYREKCIREKGNDCFLCDSPEEIEVHHIDGDRQNNDIDNLIPVCKDCHNNIHNSQTSIHKEWSEKYEERDTITIGPKDREEILKATGNGNKGVPNQITSEDVMDLVDGARNTRFENELMLSSDDLKELLHTGWVVIHGDNLFEKTIIEIEED